ncbi:MAG TPA: F0F1 ATP synthase subunit delta [Burkholderiales bacterium]|nr:F0F1 ATP synthase subunit delta [Burkholderiales bacterium]
MAENVTIARPYAEAVFRLAKEKNTLPQWGKMLALLQMVATEPQVVAYISNPNFSAQQIESLLLGICGEKLDGMGRNFVQVLARNDRLSLLPEIRELFEALKAEQEGVLEVKINSAFPLSKEQESELVQRLKNRYQRKVVTQLSVEPELIGGVIIAVGDHVLDATVRGKLETMRAALTR